MEYFCAWETIHRFEKRSSSENMWYMPGTIHRFEKRSSLSQVKICGTCLKQFIAFWKRSCSENMWYMPGTIHRFEKLFQKWNIFACLKQFIFDSMKNDSRKEYVVCPEQFIAVEKRPWNGILLRAWNNSCMIQWIIEKRSSSGEYAVLAWNNSCVEKRSSSGKCGAPGTIHVWFIENRSSSGICGACLEQFIALKNYFRYHLMEYFCSPETILVWKAILKWNICAVPGKIHVWKTILEMKICGVPGTIRATLTACYCVKNFEPCVLQVLEES